MSLAGRRQLRAGAAAEPPGRRSRVSHHVVLGRPDTAVRPRLPPLARFQRAAPLALTSAFEPPAPASWAFADESKVCRRVQLVQLCRHYRRGRVCDALPVGAARHHQRVPHDTGAAVRHPCRTSARVRERATDLCRSRRRRCGPPQAWAGMAMIRCRPGLTAAGAEPHSAPPPVLVGGGLAHAGTAVVLSPIQHIVHGTRVVDVSAGRPATELGPVLGRLYHAFRAIQTGDAPDEFGWMHVLPDPTP